MLTVGLVPRTVIVTLSLPVAPSLAVTVKVKVTTWFAAVVRGAVQIVSSTAGSTNVPAVAVHRRVAPGMSALRDVARSLRTVPPSTVWSTVSIMTSGPLGTVIVTLAMALPLSLAVTSKVKTTAWSVPPL